MKNYKQKGDVIEITAESDILSGDIVEFGALIGIAVRDALTGEKVAISIAGVYEVAKEADLEVTAGLKLYYNAGVATTTDTGVLLGHAAADSAADETTVLVRLSLAGSDTGGGGGGTKSNCSIQIDDNSTATVAQGALELGGLVSISDSTADFEQPVAGGNSFTYTGTTTKKFLVTKTFSMYDITVPGAFIVFSTILNGTGVSLKGLPTSINHFFIVNGGRDNYSVSAIYEIEPNSTFSLDKVGNATSIVVANGLVTITEL